MCHQPNDRIVDAARAAARGLGACRRTPHPTGERCRTLHLDLARLSSRPRPRRAVDAHPRRRWCDRICTCTNQCKCTRTARPVVCSLFPPKTMSSGKNAARSPTPKSNNCSSQNRNSPRINSPPGHIWSRSARRWRYWTGQPTAYRVGNHPCSRGGTSRRSGRDGQ